MGPGIRSDQRVTQYGAVVDERGASTVPHQEFMSACEGLAAYFFERTREEHRQVVAVTLARQQLDVEAVERVFGIPIRDLIAQDETEYRRILEDEAAYRKEEYVQHLRSLPYEEYLKTEHWRVLRQVKLTQSGDRCQLCSTTKGPLEVHHNTYRTRGEERLSDLLVLCSSCHSHHHNEGDR